MFVYTDVQNTYQMFPMITRIAFEHLCLFLFLILKTKNRFSKTLMSFSAICTVYQTENPKHVTQNAIVLLVLSIQLLELCWKYHVKYLATAMPMQTEHSISEHLISY